MARRRVGAAMVALLIAVSCDGADRSGPAEPGPPSASCGRYTAEPARELTAEQEAVRDCFLAAHADGRQAEVVVVTTTIEGDEITTVYRVVERGVVEVLVDASADRFSDLDVYRQRCSGVAAEGNTIAATGCEDLGTS